MDVEKLFLNEKALFGKRVIELRDKIGISQKKLGEICEINRSEISRIENGKKNLEFFTIIKLAQGLGIELVTLFDYKNKFPFVETQIDQSTELRFENEKMALGKRIQTLRKLRNISQVDIDVAIGLPDSDLSRIENAIANMKLFSLFRIAEALDVKIVDLFNYEEKLPFK
ncbi:MAG TPA: helix-turn-helix transcriptional regulator [Flavisolibacter sp.]|jgi:transcriptional regulator with XRE-family HTH domain|nr:helix-turn-helix transcriptional regulator [Flavisolibacter sp.]